jgi:hypothetical protein
MSRRSERQGIVQELGAKRESSTAGNLSRLVLIVGRTWTGGSDMLCADWFVEMGRTLLYQGNTNLSF